MGNGSWLVHASHAGASEKNVSPSFGFNNVPTLVYSYHTKYLVAFIFKLWTVVFFASIPTLYTCTKTSAELLLAFRCVTCIDDTYHTSREVRETHARAVS